MWLAGPLWLRHLLLPGPDCSGLFLCPLPPCAPHHPAKVGPSCELNQGRGRPRLQACLRPAPCLHQSAVLSQEPPPLAPGDPWTSAPPPGFRGKVLIVGFPLSRFFLEFIHIKARSLLFSTEQGRGD